MDITDIIFFYFPVLLGILEIIFFRKCVTKPKVPRIVWLLSVFLLVPVFGAILSYTTLIFSIVFGIGSDDIELNEDSRFVKKWLRQ